MTMISLQGIGTEEISQEAHDQMLEEYVAVLRSLWTSYEKEVEEGLAQEYFEALSFMPLGILEVVIAETKMRYRFFPRIAEIIEVFDDEMKKCGLDRYKMRVEQCAMWLYTVSWNQMLENSARRFEEHQQEYEKFVMESSHERE